MVPPNLWDIWTTGLNPHYLPSKNISSCMNEGSRFTSVAPCLSYDFAAKDTGPNVILIERGSLLTILCEIYDRLLDFKAIPVTTTVKLL
jgi:hypothetical protein